MKTTQVNLGTLLQKVDSGEIRLPEIQRAYVWKPAQIAGLIDSLYRHYPSGSLLLWETPDSVRERDAAIDGPHGQPMTRPQYLLDGQQRLTSLHRVLTGHERARVIFNVESERFQIESAATKKDARWISVHELLAGKASLFSAVQRLTEKLPELGSEAIGARLERLKKILDYPYYIEIVEDLPYEQVTEIFVRVNSKGRALRRVDLALATLSARWPGVIEKLESESEQWRRQGYRHIDVSFLTRALAAVATESRMLSGFTSVSVEELSDGWAKVQRGLGHLIPLIKGAQIATSDLLPSITALIPLVVFLGVRPDEQLPNENANALVYWLFGAFLLSRFSGPSDTAVAQDALAARSQEPIAALYKNLGILNDRLAVTEENLVGRGANSPYFLFSYLAARAEGAKDWYFGVDISTELEKSLKLEYHHIHPRATLRPSYSRAEINDLANYAFISGKANRKIRDRKPSSYFPEIGDENLVAHFVPLDTSLREPEAYPAFLQERRRLLAAAMTALLDRYRPANVTSSSGQVSDPSLGERLNISVFARSRDDDEGVIRLTAQRDGEAWEASVPLTEWLAFFSELSEGLGSDMTIGDEVLSIGAGIESIDLPLGPLLVTGNLDEWWKVLDRELDDLQDPQLAPEPISAPTWVAGRASFSVLESE